MEAERIREEGDRKEAKGDGDVSNDDEVCFVEIVMKVCAGISTSIALTFVG